MVEEAEQQPLTKRRRLKLSLTRCRSTAAVATPNGDLQDMGPQPEPAGAKNEDSRVGREGDDEAYFSANFKTVCGSVLAEGSPERHVFTDGERATVERFMCLSGKSKEAGCSYSLSAAAHLARKPV